MRTRTGTGTLIALFLALSLLCTVSLVAQDKLLTEKVINPSVVTNIADPTSVNCTTYDAATGTICIAGQYYHGDGTTPSATWAASATSSAFGGWVEGGSSSNGCLSCHHGSITTATRGGGYLVGGHKNILRKIVAGENVYTTLGTINTNPTQYSPYFVAGWVSAQTEADSGSCFRCHTTGYRFDGNGPEPTSVTGAYGNGSTTPVTGTFTQVFTPITSAQMARVPAGGASGTTSSWSLTGIQCERCHKADMQYDATKVVANVGSVAAPVNPNGRLNHFTNVIANSVNATAATGQIPGTDFYLSTAVTSTSASRPLPNPPYALTCVECHQTGKTWTSATAGTVGPVHITPLPGFEALAPAQTSATVYAPANTLSGQFSATFGCSIPTITVAAEATTLGVSTSTMAGLQAATAAAYTACTTAGGTVTYVPGGMSHGIVATFLNSPHARVAGYVDTKNPGTPDSTLAINGGTVPVTVAGVASAPINVPGTYNTHFTSLGTQAQGAPAGVTTATNAVTGSCAGCHDIHGAMSGYFNPAVNAMNVDSPTSIATCASCHQDGSRYSIAMPTHSQGTGTPFGITAANGVTALESCVVCHMAATTTGNLGEYHFLRINSDPNYTTFPSAQQYYTSTGSGVMAPLNTYASTWGGSLETYVDGNGATQTYPAVGLDVDIACGQCHTGGNGVVNPYGLPVGTAPSFTRAQLASYAKGIHSTVPTVALAPKFSLPGSTYPANSKTPLVLTITEAIAGASICYTTDGTTPTYVDAGLATYAENVIPSCTGTAKLASSGVTLPAFTTTTTVQAIAAGANSAGQPLTPSAVVSATYTIQATAPVLKGGAFSVEQIVPLTGATLYCTNALTAAACTPATSVAGPLTITVPTMVRVVNAPAGQLASAITTATFMITPSAPTFSAASGAIAKGTSVTISGPAGSTIYYTTNGSVPTISSASGTSGSGTASVVVANSEYVRAIAVYTGGTPSSVATASYTAQ